MSELKARMKSLVSPIEVRPTQTDPQLKQLESIRAVVFDIYGTLLISGSGDIGVSTATARPDAFEQSVRSAGFQLRCAGDVGVARLHQAIGAQQEALRARGTEYPEIDIREVWLEVIKSESIEALDLVEPDGRIERCAVEYEMLVNPTWLMPHAVETVQRLGEQGLQLGIVSNAQFFTPILCEVLCGRSLHELGFPRELAVYSFEHLQAKPGEFLYELAAHRLADRGIAAEEVLYVGNDMLNDVLPARSLGFKTALFAGDARSLRWREGDERVQDIEPDLIVTDLAQIVDCVQTGIS